MKLVVSDPDVDWRYLVIESCSSKGFHTWLANRSWNSKPVYLALISGDISSDVTYTKDLLFSSLKSHRYVEGTTEIIFSCHPSQETDIT